MPAIVLVWVLFASCGPVLLAIAMYVWWRKSTLRRSPLASRQIGHVPGQQLVERVYDHSENALLGLVIMALSGPFMLLAWCLARIPPDAWTASGRLWPFILAWVAMLAIGLWEFARHHRHYLAARDGLLAERVTGMQLNRLTAQGCVVMHDLPAEGFNLDHVVIAPRGVYAVETKSFRKPRRPDGKSAYRVEFDGALLKFPDFVEKSAVEQSMRQARWLSGTLREALGRDVPVIPALALPGWMIEQSAETWRAGPVKVFSPMKDGANFMAQPSQTIDPDLRRAVANALAVRYPAIAG